jgi:glucan phosphoethanolaminetransferase (alkaline phosphatase superfamily)
LGTLAGSAAGRVCYQMALTATEDDNGYVTMFFLLIPALSSLISFMLSWWIPGLQFVPSAMFFVGLALVTISLLMLWFASWRKSQHSNSLFGATLKDDDIEPASADCRGQLFPDDRHSERRGAA